MLGGEGKFAVNIPRDLVLFIFITRDSLDRKFTTKLKVRGARFIFNITIFFFKKKDNKLHFERERNVS